MRQTNRIRHAEEEKKREGKCHGILFGRMGAVYMGNDKKEIGHLCKGAILTNFKRADKSIFRSFSPLFSAVGEMKAVAISAVNY